MKPIEEGCLAILRPSCDGMACIKFAGRVVRVGRRVESSLIVRIGGRLLVPRCTHQRYETSDGADWGPGTLCAPECALLRIDDDPDAETRDAERERPVGAEG